MTNSVKQRQSNFELLLIVCMLMVIATHAKLGGTPEISQADIQANPSLSFLWVLINQILVICVDVFVMISGWFGIKASWKGVGKLLFQVLFIALLCTLVCAALGVKVLNGMTLACLVGAGYWFVPAYLVLYAISPALNMFIEEASQKTYINVLILFFACEFIYGYLFTMGIFDRGFSPMSFVGLYLLAAYIRKYPNKLTTLSKGWDFAIWFGITILSVLIFYFGNKYWGIGFHLNHNYSPLVIAASAYFLLGFSKIKMGYNKFINWLTGAVHPLLQSTWCMRIL